MRRVKYLSNKLDKLFDDCSENWWGRPKLQITKKKLMLNQHYQYRKENTWYLGSAPIGYKPAAKFYRVFNKYHANGELKNEST